MVNAKACMNDELRSQVEVQKRVIKKLVESHPDGQNAIFNIELEEGGKP